MKNTCEQILNHDQLDCVLNDQSDRILEEMNTLLFSLRLNADEAKVLVRVDGKWIPATLEYLERFPLRPES